MRIARLTIGTLICAAAYGQPAAPRPTFEVASVKPAVPRTAYRQTGGAGTSDPGRWSCSNCSLFNLLTYAYEIWEYKIVAPDWLRTTHFDIDAKVPVGTTRQEFRLMQQNLLQERFKMVVHRENKEMAVYDLVIAK